MSALGLPSSGAKPAISTWLVFANRFPHPFRLGIVPPPIFRRAANDHAIRRSGHLRITQLASTQSIRLARTSPNGGV